jgi:menaquinone-9 beta-reductase
LSRQNIYDLAITGGGLAGLALAIQSARAGYKVILFEKEAYPFHRVCGEYISLESYDFLLSLGVDLGQMQVSKINTLQVSAPDGRMLEQALPLGGIGVSRYTLDHALVLIARGAGAEIMEKTKVSEVNFNNNEFSISTNQGPFLARCAAGCFGKRSNLDQWWNRKFFKAKKNKLNNYIGVKYHARLSFNEQAIALHNFRNGYCGIVKVDGDLYNICYLTTADNLQRNAGNIALMEKNILSENPHLRIIFDQQRTRKEDSVVISQISFEKKTQVEDHVLMIGDAAGMITPLCGNGMSMALHGSKIAFAHINAFLAGKTSRDSMEKKYEKEWQVQFASRLRTGRFIQKLFTNRKLINVLISVCRRMPWVTRKMIRSTHGSAF